MLWPAPAAQGAGGMWGVGSGPVGAVVQFVLDVAAGRC